MQEILKGQKCFLGINIAQVGAVQNAVKIDTHIISPSGVVSCVANGYDELEKVVGLMISADLINELGAYSIDLRLVFADAVIIVPTFAFAEAVEGEAPCYGISEVYVKIEGGEVVPSGSTTVEFVNREEFEQLSNKVDDLEGQIESGGGGSITIDTELSDTSDNAIANSAVAKALNSKQGTLTLTTKPNGNIVIGNLDGQTKEFMQATPSGDPMHYAYEAIGAVWNADTGYWEFIGVNDMTNEDMLEEILLGNNRIYSAANLINYASIERVIFGRVNLLLDAEWSALSADNLAPFNERLEVIQFSTRKNDVVFIQSFGWGCYGCKRLRSFFNIMDISKANIGSAFGGCVALETIMLRGLNKNVSFADSPLLSKESLLYMIRNSVQGVEITITLHPEVYYEAKDGEWEEEVTSAINEYGENITLAEA